MINAPFGQIRKGIKAYLAENGAFFICTKIMSFHIHKKMLLCK